MSSFDLTNIDFDNLDDIDALVNAGSEKGVYKSDMVDFINSEKMGKNYTFTGKKAQSVKTGFESAIEAIQKDDSLDENVKAAAKEVAVKVRKNPVKNEDGTVQTDSAGNKVEEELVFLIRQDLVREAKAAKSQAA
jgi:hypothetical protein